MKNFYFNCLPKVFKILYNKIIKVMAMQDDERRNIYRQRIQLSQEENEAGGTRERDHSAGGMGKRYQALLSCAEARSSFRGS